MAQNIMQTAIRSQGFDGSKPDRLNDYATSASVAQNII